MGSQPLLFALDGHYAHNQPDVIHLVRESGIIILCLQPHAMFEAQHLDRDFSPES